MANKSIGQANILPITTAGDLKRPKTEHHKENANLKWSLNLSSLTLSITQENQDRSIWADSYDEWSDQAGKLPAVH